ncbi:MAG TPA: sulfurtransferase [Pyrinomonadaceae bacterium]|nr:sulfurtransferase [Pyrinomonadaceae bacterium]
MKLSRFLLVALIVSALALSVQAKPATPDEHVRDSMIVSTEWLAKHLNDSSLVLLQVGDKDEYTAAHIPGAQFIQLADISTPHGQGLMLELPAVAQLKAAFEKLGVSDKSRIVVYFGKDWVTPTTRVFFTLDYLGLGDRTSVLDGGLPAWQAEKRPVTAELKTPAPGTITPRPNAKLVVDATWVNAHRSEPGVMIVDARDSKFYTGEEAGRMPRGGHIPGAKSIPYSTVVEDANNKLKSPEALRQLFTTAGAKKGDTVAAYCHIGQQGTLLYFVARYLGYDAHLYDGSFEDWSKRSELPVEKTANVTSKP